MHSQSDLENIALKSMTQQNDAQYYDGEHVAQIFKYYRRMQNPYVSHSIPLKLISGKSLYNRHRKLFDDFAKKAIDNKFDIEPYIKYCVHCGITEDTLNVCLASSTMLSKYQQHLSKVKLRKSIYRWFIKSAKNIAKQCIEDGLFTTKDFLRQIIEKKMIGNYVISGKISLYFFAAIPNFKNALPKLDYFSRQELKPLEEHYEIYHSDVNKAFLQEKNMYVNPIDFTDKIIWKMRNT